MSTDERRESAGTPKARTKAEIHQEHVDQTAAGSPLARSFAPPKDPCADCAAGRLDRCTSPFVFTDIGVARCCDGAIDDEAPEVYDWSVTPNGNEVYIELHCVGVTHRFAMHTENATAMAESIIDIERMETP